LGSLHGELKKSTPRLVGQQQQHLSETMTLETWVTVDLVLVSLYFLASVVCLKKEMIQEVQSIIQVHLVFYLCLLSVSCVLSVLSAGSNGSCPGPGYVHLELGTGGGGLPVWDSGKALALA
jgi:uncharacterized Tic20 family protein